MRLLATALAVLLTTGAAGAHLDLGLRRLAEVPRGPTGGAVLGTMPAESACDDALADVRCSERAALAAYARRQAEIDRLSVAWSEPVRRALTSLCRAEHRFAAALARHEVDRRGTDRDDQAQAAAEAQEEAFVALLRRTAGNTGRSIAIDLSPGQADATLNETYAIVMAEPIDYGSVTRGGVRETQRSWLAYRDAFVALAAALERPTAPLEAELTAARTRGLQGLIAD